MGTLRLGTRGSRLARRQSRLVEEGLLRAGVDGVETVVISTRGDEERESPLAEIGGTGLFTRELDRALLAGEIDVAVHSLKDMPTTLPPGLTLAAVPPREDPRDVLAGPSGGTVTLSGLPRGARVGTSSLRRTALALAFRPDLRMTSIRGNVDTRLAKLDAGEFDAVILAAAGLRRLGLEARAGEWLERTAWLPAPAQGALAVVTRSDDATATAVATRLDDAAARAAVVAERAVLAELHGGCQVPLGALGLPYDGGLRLWALVASPDGRHLVRSDRTGGRDDPETLGRRVAADLVARGGREILDEIDLADAPPLSHP